MIPPYVVSQDLLDLYDYDPTFVSNTRDLRPWMFYNKYVYPLAGQYVLFYGNKFGSFNDQVGGKGMRVAEAYLNRAEAYIRYGQAQDAQKALDDLNTLRRHRHADGYVDLRLSDIPDLLTFCREERRRELSFEEHRWFDLRRYGMPAIKHVFHGEATETPREITIPAERYVLPFSREVLDRNPNLVPNP
jgi:hypothetical protein